MMENTNLKNPLKQYAEPPFSEPKQEVPGHDKDMQKKPDYGENSYQGSGKLKGRKALITGGDSGIGRAVAIAFAREGADVAISFLNEDEDARESAKWVEQAGRKSLLLPGDISDENHCKQLVTKVMSEFGQIDILVNNAAFQMSRNSLQEISTEEWDYTFKTNIYPLFFYVRL